MPDQITVTQTVNQVVVASPYVVTGGGGGGSGTVTSVGLSLPGIFTVSGSPVTVSGTLTGTLATQTANTVWAGPTTGSPAAPGFRALVAADLPSHTHTASQISDSTVTGRAVLTATDQAAGRTALGLGTLATQSGTFSGTSSGTNTGDQTITLTGDVTGTGTGSFAATIASNAVTYAKIQDVSAASRLLGRGAGAGAGDPQEITLGTNLSMTGTTLSATGVTAHSALTGLANDDHTQYLIGNVGTSTTRNVVNVGTAGRGLDVRMTDSTDTAIQISNAGGTAQIRITAENGIDCTGGGGGFTGSIGQFSGTVTTGASTTLAPSLRLPHGTAPTTPADGDIWTTTGGVFARVNGATQQLQPTPVDAQYLTLSTNGTLTNERVLTAGTNISITDGGAGGLATVALSISGAAVTRIPFYDAGPTLATTANFTYNASANGGLRVDSGHLLVGGGTPSTHTATIGFRTLFFGGDAIAAGVTSVSDTGYEGLSLTANRTRSTSTWVRQNTGPVWSMNMLWGSMSDYYSVERGESGTAGSVSAATDTLFLIDKAKRAVFQGSGFISTTGFTAKLAVTNVGGTASDAVLLLRGNASQSGNYFTAQTSGGTTVASITSGGSLTIDTAGQGLRVKEGSNAKQGTATLVAGTVTVSNTSVTANSRIFLTSQSDGGTPGFLRVSARSAGTSFTITSSSNTDTSTVAYQIFEPA